MPGSNVVRVGFMNNDKRPSISFTIGNSANNDFRVVWFQISENCGTGGSNGGFPLDVSDTLGECRYFSHLPIPNNQSYFASLSANMTSFFDFGEFGAYSIFISTINNGIPEPKGYFNFLTPSNYFLKASGKVKEKKYGSTCVGCTFRLILKESVGDSNPLIRKL